MDNQLPPTLPATSADHEAAIAAIIEQHFNQAEQRIPEFYHQVLASPRSVMARHWRHKRDIPRDLAALPRRIMGLGKWLFRIKNLPELPSQKELEVKQLIEQQWLQLPLLEQRIKDYCLPFEAAFQQQVDGLRPNLTADQQQQFEQQLARQIERLSLPQEGAREALLFTLTGMLGRSLSDKVAFGSALGTGSAAATSLYLSQQSWAGVLWFKMVGVPGWVGAVGMASGVLALLLAAPLIAPILEIGINRWRGPTVLHNILAAARQELLQPKPDAVNIVSVTATYLQALPEVMQLLRNFRL